MATVTVTAAEPARSRAPVLSLIMVFGLEGVGRLEHLDALFGNYIAVLISTVFGFILVISALIGSRLLAPFSEEGRKGTTYECGMLPIKRASTNVGMRF